MSDGDLWIRANALLRETDSLPEPDRQAALDRAVGHEPALREAIDALLAAQDEEADETTHGSDDGLTPVLDDLVGRGPSAADAGAGGLPSVPGVELTAVLGRGGSGDVFAGRQVSPERPVAVKVMRTGLGSRRAQQRFDREAQALASIQHDAVTAIYAVDRATLPSGATAPCIIMELVEGRPLAEHRGAMPVDEAARLVASVARGAHAAHQRGMVHRDLKPANVILTPQGRPKIVDFGVAMLRDAADTDSIQTVTGEILGTIAYMSPEQLAAGREIVDVRTDVYALGLIFYELTSGRAAIDRGDASSLGAIQTIIKGQLPRLGGDRSGLSADAEAVYRKATALETDRRYDSAAALADDLERLAEGRPVLAQPPTASYLARRFVRRNPALSAVAAAGSAAVVLLSVLATAGFVTASRERDAALRAQDEAVRQRELAFDAQAEAEVQADLARAAERRMQGSAEFLRSMLASPDPESDGASVRLVDVLDRWSTQIDGAFPGDPAIRLDLHRTLGWTYASLARHSEAIAHFGSALALADDELEPGSDERLQLETNLVNSMVFDSHDEAAVELGRAVVDRLGAASSADTVAAAHIALADAEMGIGESEAAAERYSFALEHAREHLGPDHPQTLSAMSGLGRAYIDLGYAGDAREQFETLLASYARLGTRGSHEWYIARGNLAMALAGEGEHGQAVVHYEDVLRDAPPLLGEDHHTLHMVRSVLPDTYAALGREEDAIRAGEAVIDEARRLYGPDHADYYRAMGNHSVVLMQLGRSDEAIAYTSAVAEAMPRLLGPEHPRAMIGLRNHAAALDNVGRDDEAAELLYELLGAQSRVLGDDAFDTLITKNNLAYLLERIDRAEEAAELMSQVLGSATEASGYPASIRAVFSKNYGSCLLAAGRLDEAETALRSAVELDPANSGNVEKAENLLAALSEARRQRGG